MPQVGAGTVDPRHIAVSLSATLRRTRHVPGHAVGVDFANHSITVAGPDGQRRDLAWHRLVLTPGSVSRTLPIPGILDQAKGFNNIAEALYLRDHVLGQMELADASDDPAQRQARCTFVVVGAGTTGTEVAAQGLMFTRAAPRRYPRIGPDELRWLLVDRAPGHPARTGPAARGPSPAHPAPPRPRRAAGYHNRSSHRQPGPAIGRYHRAHPHPGVDRRRHTRAAHPGGRAGNHQRAHRGRRILTVPSHPDVFAAGDAAAAPDLTRPGQLTAMTAQHAQRQGKAIARNVAATFGHGTRKPYKHRDLGSVVDLGGWQAVANPLRVATDWFNDIIEHRQLVQLGLIPSEYSGLAAAEHTDIYYKTDGQPLNRQRQESITGTPGTAGRR